jgi:ribosomal protein S27AE
MAEKKAKTAEKSTAAQKHSCPSCGSESRVTFFAGHGPKGLFWVCDKNCGYTERTR